MAAADRSPSHRAGAGRVTDCVDADSLRLELARNAASTVLEAGMPQDRWNLPPLCYGGDKRSTASHPSAPSRSHPRAIGADLASISSTASSEAPFTSPDVVFGFFNLDESAKTGISLSGGFKSLRDAVLGTAHYIRAMQPDTRWVESALFEAARPSNLAAVVPGIHTMSRLFREHFPALTDMPAFLALAVHDRIRELADRDEVARRATVNRAISVFIQCMTLSQLQVAKSFGHTSPNQFQHKLARTDSAASAMPSPHLANRQVVAAKIADPEASQARGGATGALQARSPLAASGAAIVAGHVEISTSGDQTAQHTISTVSTANEAEALGVASNLTLPTATSAESCRDSVASRDLAATAKAEIADLLRTMSTVRLGDALTIALGGDPTLGEMRFGYNALVPGYDGIGRETRKSPANCSLSSPPYSVVAFRTASGALDHTIGFDSTAAPPLAAGSPGGTSAPKELHGFLGGAARAGADGLSSVVLRTREPTGQPRLKHDCKAVSLVQCLRWWPVTDPRSFDASNTPDARAAARAVLGQAVIVAAMSGPSMSCVPRTITGVEPDSIGPCIKVAPVRTAGPRIVQSGTESGSPDALTDLLEAAERRSNSPIVDVTISAEGMPPSLLCSRPGVVAEAGPEMELLFSAADAGVNLGNLPSPHTPSISPATMYRRPPCPASWRRPCARGMPRPSGTAHRAPLALRDSSDIITMADMQLLVDFLVQRHPDLARVKSDRVERHRYTCYVNAFCIGAMRGYTATAVTSADVNDSNFVTMLRSCSKSRLAGLLPFDPQAAHSLSRQFQDMIDETAAHAYASQHMVPEMTSTGVTRLRRAPHKFPPIIESATPDAGPAIRIEHLHAAAMAGRLPGLFGSPAAETSASDAAGDDAGVAGSFEAIGVPFEVLRRVAFGAPRRVASGVKGYICFEDLVWLCLAVQDAMAGPSIEYWCRVLDSDEDGWIDQTDIRQAVRSRVRQQLQLDAMAAGHAAEAAASRVGEKLSTKQATLLVQATEQRAMIQLVDVMRPPSYVAASSQAEQCVRFTSSQIRHRMAGPVVFHSLVSLRDRVGAPQAAGAAAGEPATMPT